MKLKEIFDQLTHGEFNQLAIGGKKGGEIAEDRYPVVVAHINLGLTALFSRFTLKEGRVLLRPTPGQLNYVIDSRFAVNAVKSTEPVRYFIDDPADKFDSDTVIKVEKVLDKDELEQDLNLQGSSNGFFTPSLKTLRLPKDWTGDVTLVYRQNHPQIVIGMGFFDPAKVEVELPYTHLEALLFHVASRAHNPVGMVNEFNMGNNYAAKYEQACARLEQVNIQPDKTDDNDRLRRNGWV